MNIKQVFEKISYRATVWTGEALTFIGAIGIILVWAVFGPATGYSDTWQLVINTFTTLITFLMVFLIQNSQNREMRAVNLKLDELIRSFEKARNELINVEEKSVEIIDKEKETMLKLVHKETNN
jgi:low affinity Fe/Cu permease